MHRLCKIISIYIVLSIVSMNVSAEEQLTPQEIYKNYQDAIATIYIYDKDGKPIAQGSGFFISDDGVFVTNLHVISAVEEEGAITINLRNGALFCPDDYIGYDADSDIIILKVEGKNLPFLKLGNSYELSVGDNILVISSPRGLENSMSTGIISAIREAGDGSYRFIQSTAEISPGSSGGPFLNMKGEAIGVATYIVGEGEALSFAVPIEYVKKVFNKKIEISKVSAVDDTEKSANYYYRVGIMAIDAKNYKLAEDYFKRAISINEKFDRPYYELASIYYDEKKFQDELEVYEKLIKIKPLDADAHYNYAISLENNNREIEAIKHYKTALKFEPDHQDALFNIGFLYILHGQLDKAKMVISKLYKINDRWANQLERLIKKLEPVEQEEKQ